MSSKHKKYCPYIRRLKPSDKADDFRTAVRLAVYLAAGWSGWVIAQHGFPGVVTAVERDKRELMRSPLVVYLGEKTFKQWARGVQRHAAGSAQPQPPAPEKKECPGCSEMGEPNQKDGGFCCYSGASTGCCP